MGYAQRQQGAPLWLLGESTQVAVFAGHFLITFGVTSLFPFGSLLGHFWCHFLVHFLILFGITCVVTCWVTFGSLFGYVCYCFVTGVPHAYGKTHHVPRSGAKRSRARAHPRKSLSMQLFLCACDGASLRPGAVEDAVGECSCLRRPLLV